MTAAAKTLEAQYRALADGPALVERSDCGLLELTGADRAAWLHNLTTNHVRNLAPSEGHYAFALSVQGRILFDLNILNRPGSLWLDLDRRFVAAAKAHFHKYIVTEDVTIADRSNEFVCFALVGRNARDVLADMAAPHAAAMPQLGTTELVWRDVPVLLLRHDFCGPFAVELFVPADQGPVLWSWLTDRSRPKPATPVGRDAVWIRRIEAGLPWPVQEINDEYVPAETGQLARAVSFDKGCYLGQEVVERMRSRGVVARRLVGLRFNDDVVPPAGTVLLDDGGKTVGKVTSACRSFTSHAVIGLGYVQSRSAEPGTTVRASLSGGLRGAVVAALPFVAAG